MLANTTVSRNGTLICASCVVRVCDVKVSLVYSDVGKLNNESDAIFARIDVNGDGGITRDEFMAAMSADPELRAKMQGLLMKSQVNTIFKGSTSKVAH
jgi:hypothetical protein